MWADGAMVVRGRLSRASGRIASRFAAHLVPRAGFGAQGGTARNVASSFDSQGLGAIVNNSRHHLRTQLEGLRDRFGDARWQDAVAAAATRDMIAQLKADTPAGKL